MDGWVSLEVSPLLARDTQATITQATALHAFARVGIDHDALAAELQSDDADSSDSSWQSQLASIAANHQQLSTSST